MEKKLTELEAFETMKKFLEKYYSRTHSDDLALILGELQLTNDGHTMDPAAWDDWQKCVKMIIEKKKTQ